MKKVLAVLAIAALAMPAMGQTVFFQATGDGCFDTYRSSSAPEGYSNGGGASTVRIEKYNQAMGWMSFYGSTADGTGQTLTSFLAANPNATATLYFRSAGVNLTAAGAYMETIRTGNTGALVEDQGNGNGYGPGNPDPGFVGASELVAWRGASTAPLAAFPNQGDGLYCVEDPNSPYGPQGVAWKTPSTRLPNMGASPFKWGPNEEVRYDKGLWAGSSPTGKYLGYFNDTPSGGGRSYWALEDVLGLYNNNARSATLTDIANAGQILNTDSSGNPLLVNNALYVAADPRQKSGGVTSNWVAVQLSAAFLADMANNPENKGFVFVNNISGLAQDWSNADFYTKDHQGGIYAPYLAVTVPEPATMILVALGGLALFRRRLA